MVRHRGRSGRDDSMVGTRNRADGRRGDWLGCGDVASASRYPMSAAGRIRLAVVLLVGAVLAEGQMAEGNEPGGDPHCPPAPTLVVDGTVLAVDVPRARCWSEIVATGPETCLTSRLVGCENGVTATIQAAGQPIQTPSMIPAWRGLPRADTFRICALPPGTYDVTLCAADTEPIACAVAVGAGQTIDIRMSHPLPTARVRVKVDAAVLGEAGAEVAFESSLPHRVGERGRFALGRMVRLADPPKVTDYTEYECYRRYPPPVTRRGCAGCCGGGAPGWICIAAALALLRTWRR